MYEGVVQRVCEKKDVVLISAHHQTVTTAMLYIGN